MKYLFALHVLFLFGCSNNDDLATSLLNDKKIIEDSIALTRNYESYYIQQAKEEMRNSSDSLRWKSLVDSSTYFYGRGMALKEKLETIEFSLDSISRMK